MFLYINIMALKVVIVTISILAFLMFVRYTEDIKENFISNLRKRKEHFENLSIQNVHADNHENTLEQDTNEENDNSTISNSEIENNLQSNNT